MIPFKPLSALKIKPRRMRLKAPCVPVVFFRAFVLPVWFCLKRSGSFIVTGGDSEDLQGLSLQQHNTGLGC